jgi:hypothetical protein
VSGQFYNDDDDIVTSDLDLEYENLLEEDDIGYTKPRRGPKKGKRQKDIACKEFEQKVIPLFQQRNIPKSRIDKIIKESILDHTFITQEFEPESCNLTAYIKEYWLKDKEVSTILKANKGITLYFTVSNAKQSIFSELQAYLDDFYLLEEQINKLKYEYVWKCWEELDQRCRKISQNIVYTKSLTYEESENLAQDTALYFHHLHIKYDPFFLEGKTMPYKFYMLSMVRQKLRYHVQAYHLKKNKEDLKEEISDFDMPINYINTGNSDVEEHDLRSILRAIEEELPSDKHRIVFEMLKDGHKQKSIASAIDYTQSWVSIIKKKIRAAIIKKVKETGQENLLEAKGINVEDYNGEDLENIWE